jgi:Iron-sulfur cluster-binding domain
MTIEQSLLDNKVKYILRSYPRGSQANAISYSCDHPKRTVNVDLTGDCFLCSCEAWLPLSVGKITDFAHLEDIWNNVTAKELQQDIADKKFTYCAVEHCGIVDKDIVLDQYQVSINIDESCNLACPSCRKEQINHLSGDIFEEKQRYINHFVQLINNFDKPLHLTMSGNGDPLASASMRPLVLNWVPKTNQTIKLFTNGLLMKKLLPDSTIFPNIKEYQLSVDAGSASVYEVVRRPGKFSVLQENLQWLADNRLPGTQVSLLFCVSANNANDIVNFANMCSQFGFIGGITKLDNWYTFDNFSDYDVIGNADHPLRNTALKQLRVVNKMSHISINPFLQKFL